MGQTIAGYMEGHPMANTAASAAQHTEQAQQTQPREATPAPLPPGPRTPGFWNVLQNTVRPIEFYESCRRRYGERFTVNLMGTGPVVFLSEPDAIEDVFKGDGDSLHAGEANEFLEDTLGPNSLLVLDGAEHRRQRQPQAPPFMGEKMRAHTLRATRTAAALIANWTPGRKLTIENEMSEVAMSVILESVFGVTDAALMAKIKEQTRELMIASSHPLAVLGASLPLWLQKLAPQYHRLHRDLNQFTETIYELLAARRDSADERDDILSIMLTMTHEDGTPITDKELRDHLITTVLAGHGTTAASLAWAFRDIYSHPEIVEKIRAELRAVFPTGEIDADGLEKLPYLDAAIKESLRLHPIIPFVLRRLTRPFSAGGVLYPAGIVLAPSILLAHSRPETYPEPEQFKPERFLGIKPNPYTWIPFGGGTRRCLGMFFALFEMRVVLAAALSRVDLELVNRTVSYRRRGLLIAPADGTRVVVSKS